MIPTHICTPPLPGPIWENLLHEVLGGIAAFDVDSGAVISQTYRRRRAVEFKKFLIAIDKAVPAELDVHLVGDNLSTHKTPAVNAWLDRHPRFQMHVPPQAGDAPTREGRPGPTRSNDGSGS